MKPGPENETFTEGGIAWGALILGIVVGLVLGLLYTWEIDPVIERNTAPWQLGPGAREEYVVAVALSYAYNRDLNLAFDRLRALRPDQNVWSLVAEVACDRVKTGDTKTNSDIRVIRALEQLYRPQGASGCADGQYPTPAPQTFLTVVPTITPTASLTPPPTKTPTPPLPTSTPFQFPNPTRTPPPSGSYALVRQEAFCSAELSGVIEVRVYDRQGNPVAGIPVEVSWSGSEKETFYTGLKPGREPGYADFEMTAGRAYTVTLPGLVAEPRPVAAEPCEAEADGESIASITSYRINFEQQGE